MARVFTITEGLENMGALRTGGQGSVYKARRMGPVISAVKLLPTPIHSESLDDKNYRDFTNEVEKLKKVNEIPNPNVVKILSYGLTESGNLPFIEMEYIEGPDLEELLKPPHDALFSVKEIIRVAEHLSHALAHCHKVNVKHGDVKSNNVKLNVHSGNYVLLDFGLAVMSDEQRRTSLRHAGAIEFMAPEQNEGQMLFETDVYSFGIIIYELIAGIVPFPLTDKGETARNTVMVAHMEKIPPDPMVKRRENMPDEWTEERRQIEMLIPDWLLQTVSICLEKKPADRFPNGMELYNHISYHTLRSQPAPAPAPVQLESAQGENGRMRKLILEYQEAIGKREQEIEEVRGQLAQREAELVEVRNLHYGSSRTGVSRGVFFLLLFLLICFAAFSAYMLKGTGAATRLKSLFGSSEPKVRTVEEEPLATVSDTPRQVTPVRDTKRVVPTPRPSAPVIPQDGLPHYFVASKAFFHNDPDTATRRNAFLLPDRTTILSPIEERDGFIYVIFTNSSGQTSRGWINLQDLELIP